VQAKRLLPFCAEQHGLPWHEKLNVAAINLGSGPRTIHAGGRLNKTYNLVINPPEVY